MKKNYIVAVVVVKVHSALNSTLKYSLYSVNLTFGQTCNDYKYTSGNLFNMRGKTL